MSSKLPGKLAVHLASQVRATRHRYRKRLARCQQNFSEDAVHDLRIESRRILALLDLLEALRFTLPLRKLARNLKKRLDALDDLRDTQVQRRLLRPLWRQFPPAHTLKQFLRRCEDKLAARLARKVRAAKYSRLNRRLKQVEKCLCRCAGPRSRRASETLAAAVLCATFERVALLRRQVRPQNAAAIHRLRVAFKRFRYMNELLRPLVPGLTAKQLARMKKYQAAAGDIQDLEVLLGRLASLIAAGDLKSTDTKGLQSELLRRRRRAIDSFMMRIDELFEFGATVQKARPASRRPGRTTRPTPSQGQSRMTSRNNRDAGPTL